MSTSFKFVPVKTNNLTCLHYVCNKVYIFHCMNIENYRLAFLNIILFLWCQDIMMTQKYN